MTHSSATIRANLSKARQALERTVDRCYRSKAFGSEGERVGYLFEKYEEVVGGVLGASNKGKSRKE